MHLSAASLSDLKETFTAKQKFQLDDYLKLAAVNGEVGQFADSRTAKLLLRTTETFSANMQAGFDAGRRAFGLVVSKDKARQFLRRGSLKIDRGEFILLTDSQLGLTVPVSLIGPDEVMLVLAVAMIENIQAVPVDVDTGNALGRWSVLSPVGKPTLKSMTEAARLLPNFYSKGRYSMISSHHRLPIWSLKQILTDADGVKTLRAGLRSEVRPDVVSTELANFHYPLPFAKVPVVQDLTTKIVQWI